MGMLEPLLDPPPLVVKYRNIFDKHDLPVTDHRQALSSLMNICGKKSVREITGNKCTAIFFADKNLGKNFIICNIKQETICIHYCNPSQHNPDFK